MQVVVQVDSLGSMPQKVWMSDHQRLRVGRTEWADLAVPQDQAMATIHFELHSAHNICWIRDLDTMGGTYVNGAQVVERCLNDGDVILAGQTRFRVAIEQVR